MTSVRKSLRLRQMAVASVVAVTIAMSSAPPSPIRIRRLNLKSVHHAEGAREAYRKEA